MTDAPPAVATPRPAVTVLLVRRDPLAVLMVERGAVGAFPGVLAFPGGVVDPGDADERWLDLVSVPAGLSPADFSAAERARRIAVARELWEETGLLLGATPAPAPASAASAAPAADSPGAFFELVRSSGVRLDLGVAQPLSRWVTPEILPKRFDTHFYAAEAPDAAEVVADGIEIAGVEWVRPEQAEALLAAGERRIMYPTMEHLRRLAREGGDWSAWTAEWSADPVITRPKFPPGTTP